MAKPVSPGYRLKPHEAALMQSLGEFFDADWYRARYPDVVNANQDPKLHFIQHGIAERRDPNRFFDSAWYTEHYPDVSVSGINPLLHYMQAGAVELRNPHPRFDAAWYAEQHPRAAENPLLYHLRFGVAQGHATEKSIDIGDYLPSLLPAAERQSELSVDVVIPVYRGLQETQSCILSVLADGDRWLGRIIVVEDQSPEPELVDWLRRLAEQGRIELLRNKRNLGFVGSVNAGMDAAGAHDVVLLNSDTEVPAGWLHRLAGQAYAGARVATVSPFSNNATICGYPDNQGGPIAFDGTVAELDEACRAVNAGRWVDVPTTVGFCMYIRRDALREVGAFDAKRFTVGYGEENDFCLRATAAGWRHRLACDIFVYHKGSVSFGDKSVRLSKRATRLLLEQYPNYARDVAAHVALGAVTPYRFAVTAWLFRSARLPVILLVSHDLGGGVRRHIDSLVERFAEVARFLLLEATDRGAELSVLAVRGHPVLALPAERLDDLVRLLRSMAVSRVHVHHLLGMDMDIQGLIHALDVPFDMTVHDYHAICPQINLLPWRHSLYCNEPDIAGCNACIAHRSSHGARDIVTWRAERSWLFKSAERVFCPSADVVARLRRHGLADNAILAPHEAVAPGLWPLRIASAGTGKLRIAVLGTLVDHKGGRTVASVAELIDPRTTELHLIGDTEGAFPRPALKRMRVTGRYQEAELAGLIETIAPHVIWFPAVWPETFSYTLSAAIAAGAAIAASRIGAFTERLAGRPFTWMADIATSPMAWVALFTEIRTALVSDGVAEAVAARPSVADFYAAHYLQPLRPPAVIRRPAATPRGRIVVVPERFDVGSLTPCAYIRLLQPLHHPAIAHDFDVVLADAESIVRHEADIIVSQRFALPDLASADRLVAHARRIGATLIYDLDDDLLHVPRSHPDAGELRPLARIARRMLDAADSVWVSTRGLADRLASIRPDAVVIENRLDERIWAHAPPAPPTRQNPVRILCMGTTTHDGDFAMIEPALTRLKAEYDDRVVIDILGMTTQTALAGGLHRIGTSMHATRSYPGFVHWLTTVQPSWHIGLAPLVDTPFNLCKSAIKAMDYAAMGMLVLASDTPVYRGSLADGPAGRLVANSADAWYAAIDLLLRDPDQRRGLAAGAREAFMRHGSLAGQAQMRRDAWLRAIPARRADTAA